VDAASSGGGMVTYGCLLLALVVLVVVAVIVCRLSSKAPLAIAAVLLSLATLVGTLPALIQATTQGGEQATGLQGGHVEQEVEP
jgi:hypothetical protein